MKKQKIKKSLKRNIYSFLISFFFFGTVFGAYTSYLITGQTAIVPGSFESIISFTGAEGKQGYYLNDKDNSAIIGNNFSGYYYDSLFGYFKLDWSNDKNENVRIIDSTGLCPTGYGYKLGGKAYSEISGYIEFNYSPSMFVYYCLDDGKLHGKAYGKYIGYQNFEGIQISLVNSVIDLTEKVSNDLFINDTTDINIKNNNINKNGSLGTVISNGSPILGGDKLEVDIKRESIFYIVK